MVMLVVGVGLCEGGCYDSLSCLLSWFYVGGMLVE